MYTILNVKTSDCQGSSTCTSSHICAVTTAKFKDKWWLSEFHHLLCDPYLSHPKPDSVKLFHTKSDSQATSVL